MSYKINPYALKKISIFKFRKKNFQHQSAPVFSARPRLWSFGVQGEICVIWQCEFPEVEEEGEKVVAHVLSLQNTARPGSLLRARGVSNYLDAGVLKCLLTPHINSRGHFRRWIGACCHRLAWQIIWGGASTKLPGSRTAQGCWSRFIYLNADAVLVGIISTRWLPAMGNWHSCVRICPIYIFCSYFKALTFWLSDRNRSVFLKFLWS